MSELEINALLLFTQADEDIKDRVLQILKEGKPLPESPEVPSYIVR